MRRVCEREWEWEGGVNCLGLWQETCQIFCLKNQQLLLIIELSQVNLLESS